jgi:SAM-dependent methyltransferase
MADDLHTAFAELRDAVLDVEHLVRALASGRLRGQPQPRWRRVELRYVDLKAGRHLQVTAYDDTQAHVTNRQDAAVALDELLAEPFANWHVETTTHTHQLRVTKKGEPLLHTSERAEPVTPQRSHDHTKQRLLPEDHPVLGALGISDAQGRVKPSRQAKYRQVEEFLRIIDATIADAIASGHLRRPTPEQPLRVVDLGCGNAYLTFATHRFLTTVRGLPVHTVGVDVREQSRAHNAAVAAEIGLTGEVAFLVGGILDADLPEPPEVVLALHACDTATDEALGRSVGWGASLVLAAPCCHHDIAAQLRQTPAPAPYAQLTRHGILRERLADTLTDGLRASLLRAQGYRVDVMQFVESKHTPRNTLLRAVRTSRPDPDGPARQEYDALVAAWGIHPRLAELLDAPR